MVSELGPLFSDTFDLSRHVLQMFHFFSEGQSKCSPPILMKQQDIDMKTVGDTEGTEVWTDGLLTGTQETGQTQALVCPQSKEDGVAPESGPGDAAPACQRSYWDLQSRDGAESAFGHPVVCQSKAVSVIVCVSGCGETPDNSVPVCVAAEAEEAKGDKEILGAAKESSLTSQAATKYPGKVITTNVTINSLTVTFKEATMAEGFFKGY